MAKHHSIRAVIEAAAHSRQPAAARPGIVNHADANTIGLHDALLGEPFPQRWRIYVAVHGNHGWAECLQLVEHVFLHEVTSMQEQVGPANPLDALAGQASPPARHVGVGDDRDEHRLSMASSQPAGATLSGMDLRTSGGGPAPGGAATTGTGRVGNVDVLRAAAAFAVLLGHAYVLGGRALPVRAERWYRWPP